MSIVTRSFLNYKHLFSRICHYKKTCLSYERISYNGGQAVYSVHSIYTAVYRLVFVLMLAVI